MQVGKDDGQQEDAQEVVELDAREADRKIHNEEMLLWLEVVEVHGEQVEDEEVDKGV